MYYLLPTVSKVFERKLQMQMIHIDKYLSSDLCDPRKKLLLQKGIDLNYGEMKKNDWYKWVHNCNFNKTFVTIYELLLAKLCTYGFSKDTFTLILIYLFNRKQMVKVNNTFISWSKLIQGILQGSITGPYLLTFISKISC